MKRGMTSSFQLWRKPRTGGSPCSSWRRRQNARWKTMSLQVLQTSEARRRQSGSSGGRRRRISSTSSFGSTRGIAAMVASRSGRVSGSVVGELTCFLGDLGLGIHEAHSFSTIDGYSVDVFVVTGLPLVGTKQLQVKIMEKFRSVEAQTCTVSSASLPSLKGLQGGESRPTSTSVEIPSDGADVWEIDLKLLKFGNKVASGSNGTADHTASIMWTLK
ncbi:hypothetical protein ZWY2020_028229 [Hordeum vulgare]|nr:hypothetical protein ZWY2020_028229 [Hordeum vulgare]